MGQVIERARSKLRRGAGEPGVAEDDDAKACSWDAMRAVYEAQARRGVPEAVRGLELIEQGRWPSSGHRRTS